MKTFICYLIVMTLVVSSQCSPEDPHIPDCYSGSKQCIWFEGWYTRIIDPKSTYSFAVIVGTLNSTGESMVTILSCYGSYSLNSGIELQQSHESCQETRVIDVIAKGASVTSKGKPIVKNPDDSTPPDFHWSLPGYGWISLNKTVTMIDLKIDNVSIKAALTSQKYWKKKDPAASPEGWAGKYLPFMLPCRWYVYSVGSKATYEFVNGSKVLSGVGWGHEEKNWGKMFPEGHVWVQAISPDNTKQLLLAIVYFKVFGVTTPRLVTVGYRSINGRLNIISTSLFTYVTNLRVDPCGGEVDVTVHNPTHSIRVRATASPKSFATLFGPTNKGTWEKICAESFSSKAEVGIWTRSDSLLTRFFNFFKTGLLGKSYLVENVEFEGAALEFGEDLICKDWLTSDGKAAKILEPTEVNKKLEL